MKKHRYNVDWGFVDPYKGNHLLGSVQLPDDDDYFFNSIESDIKELLESHRKSNRDTSVFTMRLDIKTLRSKG